MRQVLAPVNVEEVLGLTIDACNSCPRFKPPRAASSTPRQGLRSRPRVSFNIWFSSKLMALERIHSLPLIVLVCRLRGQLESRINLIPRERGPKLPTPIVGIRAGCSFDRGMKTGPPRNARGGRTIILTILTLVGEQRQVQTHRVGREASLPKVRSYGENISLIPRSAVRMLTNAIFGSGQSPSCQVQHSFVLLVFQNWLWAANFSSIIDPTLWKTEPGGERK